MRGPCSGFGVRLRLLLVAAVGLAVLAGLPGDAGAATLSWGGPIRLDPQGGGYASSIQSVACPSASLCAGVTVSAQVVTFNPTAPGNETAITIAAGDELGSIACPTASQCTAVGTVRGANGAVEVTFDPSAPGDPTPVVVESGETDFADVACPSANQCTATDGSNEFTFNPNSPNNPSQAPIGPYGDLACPSVHQCTALQSYGGTGLELTFDPTNPGNPAPHQVDAAGGNQHLACPTTSQCTIVDPSGGEATFDPAAPPGAPVTTTTLDSGQFMFAIVCPLSTQCTAVDGNGEVTFDPTAPGTPQITTIDPNANALNNLACASATQCTAIDSHNGNNDEVTFNPTAPTQHVPVVLGSGQNMVGVACPSAEQCTAADTNGSVVTFNPNQSAVPAPTLVDASVFGLDAVACPSVSLCAGVDGGGNAVSLDPAAPELASMTPVDGTNYVMAVACPSTGQCTAVDVEGNEVTFNPNSPNGPISTYAVDAKNYSNPNAVACPSTNLCVVVDQNGQVVTFDPAAPAGAVITLIDPPPANGVNGLTGVACPSTTQCTAVDLDGSEFTFNPASVSSPTGNRIDAPYPNLTLGIACPSTSECITFDDAGRVVEGDPAHPADWTLAAIPNANSLNAIACASVASCVVVDSVGNAFVGTKSTSTSVSCAPGSVVVGAAASCTVTVDDVGGAPLSAPTGSVSVTSSGPGSFSAGQCTLAPSGTAGQASCGLSYTPSAVGSGSHSITAGYSGDGSHPPSSGSTGVIVTVASRAPSAAKPTANTRPASQIVRHGAKLNGLVNPQGASTTYLFQYGTSTAYGHQTADRAAGAGTGSVAASAALSGLSAGKRYHYRIVAASSAGTAYGADATFKTRSLPAPSGLSLKATPADASPAPYRYQVSGRLSLPHGMSAKKGCTGVVSVRVKHGSKVVATLRVKVSRACGYSGRVSVPAGRLHGRGSLKITARFQGNNVVGPWPSKTVSVRYE